MIPEDNNGELKEPEISLELLQYLEQVFPDQAPEPHMNDRAIWMAVGNVRVVRHLRDLFDRQHNGP